MNKKLVIFSYLLACWAWGGEVEKFVEAAEKKHGEFGEKAATFLVEGMPKGDRENLGRDFLMTNLDLALKAKKEFSWAKKVPDGIFLNDVLPYASLDETREDWRAFFLS